MLISLLVVIYSFSSLLNFSTAIYEIADTVYTGVDFCKRLCGVSVIRRCIDNPVSLFAFTFSLSTT